MKMLKYIKYVLVTIIRSVSAASLLDPIEVFYLPEMEEFYPIVSKSGNSSVKLKLINQYNVTFTSDFPEIHSVDPATVTGNKVIRQFFWSGKEYQRFAAGKKMVLIIRNPYERVFSCFLGVQSKRNILYKHPSGLHRLFRISASIRWRSFARLVSLIPDRIADRHFRSQAFYLRFGVREVLRELEVLEIDAFIPKNSNTSSEIRLNKSKSKISQEESEWLKSSKLFNWKFKEDLVLCQAQISE